MLHKRDSIWRRLWKFRTDTCPIPCKCFHCVEIAEMSLILVSWLFLSCWVFSATVGNLKHTLEQKSEISLDISQKSWSWSRTYISYCQLPTHQFSCECSIGLIRRLIHTVIFCACFLKSSAATTSPIWGGAGAWVWPWSLRCSNNPFQPGQCIWPPWQHPETERTLGEGPGH